MAVRLTGAGSGSRWSSSVLITFGRKLAGMSSAAAEGIGFYRLLSHIYCVCIESLCTVMLHSLSLPFQSSAVSYLVHCAGFCCRCHVFLHPSSLIDLGEQQASEGDDENVMDWKRQQNHWQWEICQLFSLAGEAAEVFQMVICFKMGQTGSPGHHEV